MKLSLIIVSLVVAQATKKETNDSNLLRKFVWPLDINQPQKTSYKPPTQLNYPILARITPINGANLQISQSFRAYIYPKLVSPLHYPYYVALCKPNTDTFSSDFDDFGKANAKGTQDPNQKVYVENFHEIEKDFQNQLNTKKEGWKNHHVNSFEDINRFNQTQIVPMNVKMKELTEKMKDLSTIFTDNAVQSVHIKLTNPAVTTENYKPKGNKDKERSPNVNNQSNIFQCEGVTCPTDADSCKVTEHAIEPDYEDIRKTVFCLSKNGQTLLKREETLPNPNMGSSLSSSRTHSKDDELEMAAQMKDEFDEAIKDFKTKINHKFGPTRL